MKMIPQNMDLSYSLKTKRREDNRIQQVTMTTKLEAINNWFECPSVKPNTSRLRGTSTLWIVAAEDGNIVIRLGAGFVTGREPSKNQILNRMGNALFEMVDGLDYEEVAWELMQKRLKAKLLKKIVNGSDTERLNALHQKCVEDSKHQLNRILTLAHMLKAKAIGKW